MNGTPTLQSLALYARDHFGEDGHSFEDSVPSSLDVVIFAYGRHSDLEKVSAHATAALQDQFRSRGRQVAQADVNGFVRAAITYLLALYPDAEKVRQQETQSLLSHLFWGNLVEARHAAGTLEAVSTFHQASTVVSPRKNPVDTSNNWNSGATDRIEPESRTVAARIENREHLVEAINEALTRMRGTRPGEGREEHADSFLQHAVALHADERTLARILQSVKQEIARLEEGRIHGPTIGSQREMSMWTVACRCGNEFSSHDEEELYTAIRTHAVHSHGKSHGPLSHRVTDAQASGGSETHKAIVQRWEEDVVNRGNLSRVDELSPADQAQDLKERVTVLRRAFPDLHVTIEQIVADEDRVALRGTLHGTHQGEFMGVAPTGKEVTVEAIEFFRISDDKIVEHWGSVEEPSLLQQLAMTP